MVRDLLRDIGDGTIDLETLRARLDELGIGVDWIDALYPFVQVGPVWHWRSFV